MMSADSPYCRCVVIAIDATPVPGTARWMGGRLMQRWRRSDGTEEWRDAPDETETTD